VPEVPPEPIEPPDDDGVERRRLASLTRRSKAGRESFAPDTPRTVSVLTRNRTGRRISLIPAKLNWAPEV